jgi:glycosyltransferase 2 family protein
MTAMFYRQSLEISFKVAITVGLMAWLYTTIDLNQIQLHWQQTRWGLLFLVTTVIFAVNTVISVRRWELVLAQQGIQVPFWPLTTIYTRGSVFGSFAPGGVFSGDIYRMYSLARKTGTKTASVSSVLMDRAMGVFSLLICSVGAFYYTILHTDKEALLVIVEPVVVATLVFFAAIVASVAFIKIGYLTKINSKNSVILKMQECLAILSNYFSNKRIVGAILLLSLLLQFGMIFWTYAISLSMNVTIPLQVLCMTVPLINLFVVLPLSIGGFGVRETAFVFFLVPFGLKPAEAVSISLVSAILQNGLMFFAWFGLSLGYHSDSFVTPKSSPAKKS